MHRLPILIITALLALGSLACGEFQVYTLTVVVDGAGSVADHSGQIDCPETCLGSYLDGTEVQLTARAGDGERFGVWGGSCAGSEPSTPIAMRFHKTCVASFCPSVPGIVALGVTVVGEGYVLSSPGGIDCPSDCGECLAPDSPITLTAVAFDGYEFLGWGGQCEAFGEQPSIELTLDSTSSCRASFGYRAD